MSSRHARHRSSSSSSSVPRSRHESTAQHARRVEHAHALAALHAPHLRTTYVTVRTRAHCAHTTHPRAIAACCEQKPIVVAQRNLSDAHTRWHDCNTHTRACSRVARPSDDRRTCRASAATAVAVLSGRYRPARAPISVDARNNYTTLALCLRIQQQHRRQQRQHRLLGKATACCSSWRAADAAASHATSLHSGARHARAHAHTHATITHVSQHTAIKWRERGLHERAQYVHEPIARDAVRAALSTRQAHHQQPATSITNLLTALLSVPHLLPHRLVQQHCHCRRRRHRSQSPMQRAAR
jgi:hypothetical protein